MKLLFDQNISFRIIKNLSAVFPDSSQVRIINLENASDVDIWNYAKEHDFCIVTFDSDFNDLSNLYGYPPKVLWLRSQNQTTQNVDRLLRQKFQDIVSFLKNESDFGCLEIVD